jgi:hypothetical protein
MAGVVGSSDETGVYNKQQLWPAACRTSPLTSVLQQAPYMKKPDDISDGGLTQPDFPGRFFNTNVAYGKGCRPLRKNQFKHDLSGRRRLNFQCLKYFYWFHFFE